MEPAACALFRSALPHLNILSCTRVSGGLMHRMYRIETNAGVFALKHLNPQIMARPDARDNFARAERLEIRLEEAGLPIVPALVLNGGKMQSCQADFFYIFEWKNGKAAGWDAITEAQCRIAGELLGKIHAIDPVSCTPGEANIHDADWQEYARLAGTACPEIAVKLERAVPLLCEASAELDRANRSLPAVSCITNDDMDPKNVLWEDGQPQIIDLECLDRGNPVASLVQLALQWSGITTCALKPDHLRAFIRGYIEVYNPGATEFAAVFGTTYSWIDWLEYNLRRALGMESADEEDRRLGISEALATLERIEYIHSHREEILSCFNETR